MSHEEEKIVIRKGINYTYYIPKTGYRICTISYYPEIDKYYGLYINENNDVIQYNDRCELECNFNAMRVKRIPTPPTSEYKIDKIIESLCLKKQLLSKKEPQFIESDVLQWIDPHTNCILCEIQYNTTKGYQGSFTLDNINYSFEYQYDMEKNWILMSEGCMPDLRVESIKTLKMITDLSKKELNDMDIEIIDSNIGYLF